MDDGYDPSGWIRALFLTVIEISSIVAAIDKEMPSATAVLQRLA